jgi:hypothetical protein
LRGTSLAKWIGEVAKTTNKTRSAAITAIIFALCRVVDIVITKFISNLVRIVNLTIGIDEAAKRTKKAGKTTITAVIPTHFRVVYTAITFSITNQGRVGNVAIHGNRSIAKTIQGRAEIVATTHVTKQDRGGREGRAGNDATHVGGRAGSDAT